MAFLAEQADGLVRAGHTAEAVALLQAEGSHGNAEALFILANWCLAGRFIQRNLSLSRELYGRAAEAGHRVAAATFRNFLANGTGGDADWAEAIRLLRKAAATESAAAAQLHLIESMSIDEKGDPPERPTGTQISASPEIWKFEALFTPAECAFVVACAEPLLVPSLVVDPRSGMQIPNPIRTSDGAAFPLALENPALHSINRRLAAASKTQVSQGEPLQVLRYRPGQEYRAHSDAIAVTNNQRVLTFLVWLNEDYEGGETVFLETGLEVKGRNGDGLLFRNTDENGRSDPRARHAGLPVTRGTKLIASRWIREKPIDLTRPLQ